MGLPPFCLFSSHHSPPPPPLFTPPPSSPPARSLRPSVLSATSSLQQPGGCCFYVTQKKEKMLLLARVIRRRSAADLNSMWTKLLSDVLSLIIRIISDYRNKYTQCFVYRLLTFLIVIFIQHITFCISQRRNF